MEVRPGYKQTDAGIIPNDWQFTLVGDVAAVSSGGTPSRAIAYYWHGNIPWVTTSQIDFGRITECEQFITPLGLNSSAAKIYPPGTLLMAMYGQGKTRGKVGMLAIQAATNQACAAIQVSNRVSNDFVLHYLSSQYESIRKLSNTGNQENLNGVIIKSIPLPLPPLPEQRAIAAALSDVDVLLAAQDKLIAKKRDIKQAAMQELLTGKRRLPGFAGAWDVKRLGDLAFVSKGSQLHSCDLRPGGAFAHLNGGISPSGYTYKSNTPANTIAISEGGNSCGYVQFMSEPYWCGGHCYSVIPGVTDNYFLYHALKGQQSEIMALRVGSGLPNVQKSALLAFSLQCPTEGNEQRAIAAVLSDMDAEIAALTQKRDKTRLLKQGMMQELLTGRTRLV